MAGYRHIFAFSIAYMISACGFTIGDSVAYNTMENAGFTDVKIVARHELTPSWNGCSESDSIAFEVRATNPTNGKRVNAVVCSGWLFKAATIRYAQ
jgi:hypothetical protein